MRILLDECLPKGLAAQLSGHEVATVPQAGWAGAKNGRLLRHIADSRKFDVFLTVDKNLPAHSRTRTLPFAIVVLRAKSNRLGHILPFGPEILRRISGFMPGQVYTLTSPA
jgi:predicted nuclease of predicted toxin-antitoxin system